MNNMEKPSMEIDVLSLLKKLWTKKFLIIFMALFFGTLALLYSIFLILSTFSSVILNFVMIKLFLLNYIKFGLNF